jgi:hypothetical protein
MFNVGFDARFSMFDACFPNIEKQITNIENKSNNETKNIMKSYTDLDVWKKSRTLVKDIYLLTKDFPRDEMYGLSSQMKRCAVSVPSNIAEGHGRNHAN